MKIGKYIIEIVPNDSKEFTTNLPYGNTIFFKRIRRDAFYIERLVHLYPIDAISCKHIKPNTGIRYSILGKYWIFLVIKQLN